MAISYTNVGPSGVTGSNTGNALRMALEEEALQKQRIAMGEAATPEELSAKIADLEGLNALGRLTGPQRAELNALRSQMQGKVVSRQEKDIGEMRSIYGNLDATPQFNLSDYLAELGKSVGTQRSSLAEAFDNSQAEALRNYNEQMAETRRKVGNEQASLGRLRQPTAGYNLGVIDAERAGGLQDLIRGLAARRAESRVGLESDLQNRMLQGRTTGAQLGLQQNQQQFGQRESLANQIRNIRQFGTSQNLEERKFSSGQGQNFAQNLLGQQELELSAQIGRQQAEAAKPGWDDKLMAGLNTAANVGSLFVPGAGGVSAMGNIFGKKKK